MKKSIIIISSLLMITFLAGSVFAYGSGNKGCKGQGQGYNQDCPRNGGPGALNNLTQEQRDGLKVLQQKFIDETYELRAAKFQKQQEMRMLMETSDPDRGKIDKISDKIMNIQKKIKDKQIDFKLVAKKIAPELGMGKGFRQGRGGKFQKGGQNNCQGQVGSGCGRYAN